MESRRQCDVKTPFQPAARGRSADFGDEFEFGLGVILYALTRSIPDNRERPS